MILHLLKQNSAFLIFIIIIIFTISCSNSDKSSNKIEAFKQAIRIKPDDAEAHSNLGVTNVNLLF